MTESRLDRSTDPARFVIGDLTGCAAVRSDGHSLGITLIADTAAGAQSLGTVSADNFLYGPGCYWISRFLVHEPYRGRGIGSFMLTELKRLAADSDDFDSLVVEPGGYFEDPERQRAFYTRNGFRDNGDGLFVWRSAKEARVKGV